MEAPYRIKGKKKKQSSRGSGSVIACRFEKLAFLIKYDFRDPFFILVKYM